MVMFAVKRSNFLGLTTHPMRPMSKIVQKKRHVEVMEQETTMWCIVGHVREPSDEGQFNLNPDPNGEEWIANLPELTPEQEAKLDQLPELTTDTEALRSLPGLPMAVDNSDRHDSKIT